MSDEAVTFEVTRLNSVESVRALLRTASALSDRFGLVEDRGDLNLDAPILRLRDHLVDESESREWPGTSSYEADTVRLFEANPESLAILRSYVEELLSNGEWPVPGDLHFLRSDNSPVLVTLSTEDKLLFEFEPGELDRIDKSTFELLGLREPLDPPTVHAAAVWADQADCVVRVPVDEGQWVELIPSRRLTPETYEVCCIPYWPELALGDVVEAVRTGELLTMTTKVTPSGRSVVDVEVSLIRDSPREVVSMLVDAGFLVEWPGDRLIVVNIEGDADEDTLFNLLSGPDPQHTLSWGFR